MAMAALKFPFTQLPHIESSPKRVRVFFGGEYIVDTTDALLVYVILPAQSLSLFS